MRYDFGAIIRSKKCKSIHHMSGSFLVSYGGKKLSIDIQRIVAGESIRKRKEIGQILVDLG